jgi:hypothetical protein
MHFFQIKHWFSVVCCAMFAVAQASAQSSASIEADSNYAETGNPFVVHLRVPMAAGQPDTIDFSAWQPLVPPQNVVAQTNWQADGNAFQKDLTLLFFDADSLRLPPLAVALRSGDTLRTNDLEIVVLPTPSPDDLNDMAEIKDIQREPSRWTDYLPWALAILGAVGGIALAAWLLSRRRKRAALSRAFEMSAHELALKKLDALARKQLLNKQLLKEYYAELTFVLREYLQKRFGLSALESTSEETLRQLESSAFPPQMLAEMATLLARADLAKFAKTPPPDSYHAEALAFAREVVQQTIPAPDPISETPASL